MAPIIWTADGVMAISAARLAELVRLGKVRCSARIISLDGGATWLAAVEALRLLLAVGGPCSRATSALAGPARRAGIWRRGPRRWVG